MGQAIYVIGRIQPQEEMRTFKIERVERIELLQESYSVPHDFDPVALFENAWGIWFTEEEPVIVKLRFSQRVAARVRETCWHTSEQITELENGDLLWSASIAEPREMMPWIRGWGADVEVLEPQNLREMIFNEVKNLSNLYQQQEI